MRPTSASQIFAALLAAALVLFRVGAAAAVCPLPAPTSGAIVPELEGLDTRIDELMSNWGLPGGAVAIAKDGRLVYARGFGYADLDTCDSVQPDALFRIASVSKPITATAVLDLVERGLLALDDEALTLIHPGTPIDPSMADVTIRQLLWHAGGWDRNGPTGFDPMFRSRQAADALGVPAPGDCSVIIRYMLGFPLDFLPGTGYSYSNFGYCLLGRVIEAVTGTSYADHVRTQILEPLHIHRMQIGHTRPEQRLAGEVRYYDVPGAPLLQSVFPDVLTPVPAPYGYWYQEALDSGGGWVASAPDLLRFLLGVDASGPQPDLLQPATLSLMLAPPPPASDPSHPSVTSEGENPCAPGTCTLHYGMGWEVLAVGGVPVAWAHTGSLAGTASYLVRMAAGPFTLPDASVVQLPSGVTAAALFNTRPELRAFYSDLLLTLVHGVADVTQWPSLDSFVCSDGADNDGDGVADFPGGAVAGSDPGCDSEFDADEHGSLACDDGLDDDADGFADFANDPGCTGLTDESEQETGHACDDGLDNDGDHLRDLEDPGCDGPQDPSENTPTVACDDGVDNDHDGVADFPVDPGCYGPDDPSEVGFPGGSPSCDNGTDDDGDGLIDLADPGCDAPNDLFEFATFPAWPCDNAQDDDNDGTIDRQDPGCTSPFDISEHDAALVCDDGLDNDADTRFDFPQDPGCSSLLDDSERSASSVCDDGADNDNDGATDFPADEGCASPTDPDASERTFVGTLPSGAATQSMLGGAGAVGGIHADFQGTSGGTLRGEGYRIPRAQLMSNPPPDFPAIDFQLGTEPVQYWELEFTGTFQGDVTLTFHYDDTGLDAAAESLLRIVHYTGGVPVTLQVVPDIDANTITVTVSSFSPFILGAVPQCSDGIDNDGDGLIDHPSDPDCSGPLDITEQGPISTIHVTTPADELTLNGNCSLREAIRAANLDVAVDGCSTGSTHDRILLPAGTYPLTITGAGEDDSLSGDLDLRSDIALLGAGAGVTVIDATGLGDRVMQVQPPAAGPDIDVEIHDLTLRGGASADAGGGLLLLASPGGNPTTLVDGCVVESNTAAAGGGIRAQHPIGGITTISRSTIRSNTATGSGAGGLDAQAFTVLLVDSTVSGNLAGTGPGGIRDNKFMTIRRSTIAGNQSVSGPGGIGAVDDVLSLGNTTLSGNVTGGTAGGLAVGDASHWASVLVQFTTITGNTAAQDGGIAVGSDPGADLTLGANIVAGNVAASDPDVSGAIASDGDNVIGNRGASTGWAANDLLGTAAIPIDLRIGPLANNGGATATHALLTGSPAIDGAACIGVVQDQRRVARPYGPDCDAGAYEATPACADGLDNDADGSTDFPADPGCFSASSTLENPQCQDGINNDPGQDNRIDFDGGQSIHGLCLGGACPPGVSDPNGDGVADPDAQCAGLPWKNKEKAGCGLGFELALLLPVLMRLRRRSAAGA